MRRQFRSTSDLPAEVLTAATEGDVLTANQILPSRNKKRNVPNVSHQSKVTRPNNSDVAAGRVSSI